MKTKIIQIPEKNAETRTGTGEAVCCLLRKGSRVKQRLFDVLFPPVCVFCMRYSRTPVCNRCEKAILTSNAPAAGSASLYKGDRLFCYGKYMGILRKRFIDYKFGKTLWLGRAFGTMMYTAFGDALAERKPEIVSYVPVSKKRMQERGFDQSFEMASAFASRLRVPCRSLLVCRNIESRQSGLSRNRRLTEVGQRFAVRDGIREAKGKRVLLFDDIFTTGATLNTCTQLLLDAGVAAVDGMVFASGRTDL